tara:strand:+ start:339 stop:3176 length:2838 start_codon:yes stop_codon:yes gene_type:complete
MSIKLNISKNENSTHTKYSCVICNKDSKQISHHRTHINSESHKLKVENIKLKLATKTIQELEQEYQNTDIDLIVNKLANKKIYDGVETVMNTETVVNTAGGINKKQIDGTVSWRISKTDMTENMEYLNYKQKLESIIKRCHQVLYNNGAVTGSKAMNDIMRILTLKLLEHHFKDEDSEIWKKCNEVKAAVNMSPTKFNKFKRYSEDLNEIFKSGKPFNSEWRLFIEQFICKIMPEIYTPEDSRFNCQDNDALYHILDIINELEITPEFLEGYGTNCGDIHEMFTTYGGKASSKKLGAFFTPRKLINLIFKGLGIQDTIKSDYTNPTVFDPCCGTAGFLTRAYNLCDKSVTLTGCEIVLDTIKFAFCAVLLTTNKLPFNNLKKCDAISQSTTIHDDVDIILTNPPFGTQQQYQKSKKMKMAHKEKYEVMESERVEENKVSPIPFKVIYPIKTNNGAALFTQMCVYKLKEAGLCVIVLPDGELFEGQSKWTKTWRKWLCDKVNISCILKAPSGTFDHASVKTNIVIFKNNGPTKQIRFVETTKECDIIKEIFTITRADLEENQYSLDIGEYLEEVDEGFEVPMVKLGDVLEKQKKIVAINDEKDYELIKMSKKNNPSIRNTILGSKIKQKKMQGVEDEVFIMSKILNYCYGFYNDTIKNGLLSWEFWIFKFTDKIKIKYFKYIYTLLLVNKLQDISKGVGVPRIRYDLFQKLKIPLPSIEIQEKIVGKLDQLYANIETIENRITQLKNEHDMYKEFGRKASIKSLLKGVEKVKLGDVINCKRGNLGKPNTDISKNTYPYYAGKKITGYLDTFAFSGESIMVNYRVNSRKKPYSICNIIYGGNYNCSRFSWVLSLSINNLNIKYLYHYLENMVDYTPLIKGSIPEINSTNLKNKIKIPLPSLEIQEKLIQIFTEKETYLNGITQKIVAEKKYIEELKELARDIILSYC